MFRFPFGTTQELNLDWFLEQWEIFKQEAQTALGGIDHALDAEIQRVEDAMTDLYAARDAAIAAKNDALSYAQSANTSAIGASQSAQNSAASAVTSAQQAQSAAQSATAAEGSATAASASATAAGTRATQAGNSATAAQNSAQSAGSSAGNALAQAQNSEAWAIGSIGGVPVPPTADQYENNAKYYAESISGDAAAAAQSASAAAASAARVSQSAAQIAENTADIEDLKSSITQLGESVPQFTMGKYIIWHDATTPWTYGTYSTDASTINGQNVNINQGDIITLTDFSGVIFDAFYTDNLGNYYRKQNIKNDFIAPITGTYAFDIAYSPNVPLTDELFKALVGRVRIIDKNSIIGQARDETSKIPTAETCIVPAVKFPHYPYIDSVNKTITVFSDTIIIDRRAKNGQYYVVSDDYVTSYADISSTAIAMYFDIENDSFVCGTYSVVRDASKYLLFLVIRTNEISADHVTVSSGFPVLIDGMINGTANSYNMAINSINHRGLLQYAPENTLIAFKYSKTAGFYGVETDVRFTSDGVPVLLHDATINRTARNADGTTISEDINIADITYEQALTYDFGIFKGQQFAGTKIPTFEQFVKVCRNLGLYAYIEIKVGTEQQIKALPAIVTKNGMSGKVSFISYSLTHLSYIHTSAPNTRLGYLSSTMPIASDITSLLALRDNNEIFYIMDNATGVDSEGVERLISASIPLELYTGTIESIINANTYITGYITSYFVSGKELIQNWDN